MKNVKRLLAMLLTLSMVFALAACGGDGDGSGSQGDGSGSQGGTGGVELIEGATAPEDLTFGLTPFEERQTLRIGFFTGSPLSYAFLFADNLGVFDALNVDVEYICFTGGPAMMEANSEWDIASCGLGGICNALVGYDFALVDVTDYEENMAIFVRPDSELAADPDNPDLWRGATVIYPTGTTGQAVLAQYLENIGLTMNDIESVNMDNSNGLTGFNGGNSNSTTGDFSYGVEGFLIEGGKLAQPVSEMNVTGNLVTHWSNLAEVGNDPRLSSSWRIPSLQFDGVDFSGL